MWLLQSSHQWNVLSTRHQFSWMYVWHLLPISSLTTLFSQIARRASQSRKCKLHSNPSDYATTSTTSPIHTMVPERSTTTNRMESPPKRRDLGGMFWIFLFTELVLR